jgi:hypothetical protein
LEESLSSGRIRRSSSPQASPFFFRPKAEEANAPREDPGLRPIQDYQYLNVHIVRDRYPLPLLREILQAPKLQTAQYFTVIDVWWGFNNVWIREGDEWKAAFITNRGLFEPLVMYFGMCNAPASFQRMMDVCFQELLTSRCVFVYIDDVLVASDDLEELWFWTHKVLTVMRANRLSCKPVKCQFEQRTVQYLGTIVGHGQTAINPRKAAAITEWPVPETLKQVQSFLGTCNFWWKFIQLIDHVPPP